MASLRISMPRLSNIVPLPGIPELESASRGLLRLLKTVDIEQDTRAALSRRLASLIRRANDLKHLPELTSQLLKIQRQFEAIDASRSRLGIQAAQRKLAMWEHLKVELDEIMELNMLDLLVQARKEDNTYSVAYKIIPGYKITDEVEVFRYTRDHPQIRKPGPPGETLNVTLRTGRFRKLPVAYLTFVADSDSTMHELVENEIRTLFQLRHLNVAKFVGVIQGYSGLDGIVVTMDGIDFYDFLSGTHSGAVWAKCIRGFEAFAGSAPGWTNAERITVDRDGHVVIFPGRSGRMNTNFSKYAYGCARPRAGNSVELLIKIYAHNCTSGLTGLRAFIDVLSSLGPGFTELQILKIATDCKMFPDDDSDFYGHGSSPLPLFQPNVGELGQAKYRNGELVSWKKLGRLRHIQDTDVGFPAWSSGLDYCKSLGPDGAEWVTYSLPDLRSRRRLGDMRSEHWFCSKRVNRPVWFNWKDILTEAQDISTRLNVDLSDISFFWAADCGIHLTRPEDASWNEIPTSLYYHANPSSSDPYEAEGFYSTEKTPDGGAWQERLKNQGWEFEFHLQIHYYRMRDDWGLEYERQLGRIMAVTPGSFPGT